MPDITEQAQQYHKELCAAFVKAQSAFPMIPKRHENKHFGSRYAALDDILGAVTKPLNENGLALSFHSELQEGGWMEVRAILLHTSGQARYANAFMPAGDTPQKIGSALTYGRRYALESLLGICAQDDEDGELASQKPPDNKARKAAPKPDLPPKTSDDWKKQKTAATYHSEQYSGWTWHEIVYGKGKDPKPAEPGGQRWEWIKLTRGAASQVGDAAIAERCTLVLKAIETLADKRAADAA